MTKEETTQILAILKAAYPNSYKGMTKQEAWGMVSVWHTQFADLPADIVLMAVQKCISNSTFPPSVAEVKKKVSAIHWEAYELTSRGMKPSIPEDTYKAALRIYEATMTYKNSSFAEPPMLQFIGNTDNSLLLGGGMK